MFQQVLSDIIAGSDSLALAGRAFNGREAVEKAVELSPDVVTLDVEMPVLDGISCLERIMRVKPGPVIMVSSHTRRSSAATIKALQLGAVDFVTKPQGAGELGQLASELREKILAIARKERPGRSPPGRRAEVSQGQEAAGRCHRVFDGRDRRAHPEP